MAGNFDWDEYHGIKRRTPPRSPDEYNGILPGHTPVQCTPIEAVWCPVCGDCICDREVSMNDPQCPLHAPWSNHGR